MENTTKHRGLRIPTELDEHVLNTQEHGTIKEKYVAVIRKGLGLDGEHTTEHSVNTHDNWGEQIETLQQGMKQLHRQMRILKDEIQVVKESSGFI